MTMSRSHLSWAQTGGGSFYLRIESNGSLDEPPRPRQTRCLRAIFLDGAATPPLPRGVFASYSLRLLRRTGSRIPQGAVGKLFELIVHDVWLSQILSVFH